MSCREQGSNVVYNLPSTIGYENHDPSRYRSPAFTIRSRRNNDKFTSVPGPIYDVSKMTCRGPTYSPAFTIPSRAKFTVLGSGPGPGTYQPEKCPPMNHIRRPPAFSILWRPKDIYRLHEGPGPNSYVVPPCLGSKIPDKKASSAFTIASRWTDDKTKQLVGPGPGDYGNPDYYIVKKRHPAFSLKFRKQCLDEPCSPGPVYNPLYISKKNSPMFSFGVRHSECVTNIILPEDDEE